MQTTKDAASVGAAAGFPFRLASGEMPQVIAFDLDDTLITGDSLLLWHEWLYETGIVPERRWLDVIERMMREYHEGRLDMAKSLAELIPSVGGFEPEVLSALLERFIDERIVPRIRREGRALIAAAQSEGLPVVLISATTAYIVRPIAKRLGIEDPDNVLGIDFSHRFNKGTLSANAFYHYDNFNYFGRSANDWYAIDSTQSVNEFRIDVGWKGLYHEDEGLNYSFNAIYNYFGFSNDIFEPTQGNSENHLKLKLNGDFASSDVSHIGLDVAFDLSATGDITIQNQLAGMTPEERAKEAMNLMLYGTYTAPGTVAKNNVSDNAINNLVEKELNEWSRKHLKGVDLSFGINSYNQVTEGGESKKTDYSYQFSKRLFNNKVRVSVGGRISTDNNPAESGGMEENLVDDISLEYMFGNSSKYFLKLFRHTGYESVLEGEVTQTGISVVLRKKFQEFLDMFRRKKNRQVEKVEQNGLSEK